MAKAPKLGEITLDRKGVSALLRGQLGDAATAKAQQMARVIRTKYPDLADTVDVKAYTTDRGAAVVRVAHPSARGLQVREGLMTRAAAAVGLEVRS